MVLAVMVGGQIAPGLARKVSESVLKRALVTLFLLVGFMMVLRAF